MRLPVKRFLLKVNGKHERCDTNRSRENGIMYRILAATTCFVVGTRKVKAVTPLLSVKHPS